MTVSARSLANVRLRVTPFVKALKASQAEAETGTENSKFMTPLRTVESIDVHAEHADFTPNGTEVGSFSIQNKLRRRVDVEDYYLTTDLGKINNAFARALARSEVKKIEFGSDDYSLDGPLAVNRGSVSIVGPGPGLGALNMTGTTDIALDIGLSDAQTFTVAVSGLSVTRTSSRAGSVVFRIRNASLLKIRDCRLFMDNKWGSAFDVQHGIYHEYFNILSENPIDNHVAITGGAGGGGAIGGWAVEHKWYECKFTAGNAGKGSPQDQASIILNDHVAATWMRDISTYGHLGAFVDLRGTLANKGRNTLNLFANLNCEATLANSCTLRIGAYQNTELLGGWCEGNAMSAIICKTDSSDSRVSNVQLGLKGNADGIEDHGTSNRFSNNEVVGYTSTGTAYRFKTGSTLASVYGGEARQIGSIAVNEAGTEAGHHVSGISFSSLSGTPLSGFSGSNKVRGILSHSASPFMTRSSATLDVPFGCGDTKIQVFSGTGNIDSLRDGIFYGERVTVAFAVSGQVVRDTTISSGNIVLQTATTVTSDGRLIMTFEWNAANQWWCVSTNATP